MDRTVLEKLLGEGLSLAEIGRRHERHESTVAYWAEKYGLRANGFERHAARGGLALEVLEPLVGSGMTIAEIAARVDRSKGNGPALAEAVRIEDREPPRSQALARGGGGGASGGDGSRDELWTARRDPLRARRPWLLPL